MPPNKKGGKGYKKGKGASDEPVFIDKLPDQFVARAVRILGERNVLCYCEDNVVRICHVCRRMKGREFVESGDIVLVSLRDFSNADPKTIKRGDILAKYAPEQVSKMRKEDGSNPKVFIKLEGMGISLGDVGIDKTGDTQIVEGDDDGFIIEGSESESESEKEKVVGLNGSKHQRGARQDAATAALEDIDIDAI